MIKNLLMTAAVAAMTLSASAENKVSILDDFGTSGWSSSYDAESKTVTFEGSWTGRGWWLGSADYSEFDKIVVEMAECNVPVQIVIEYNNGVTSGTSGFVPVGTTEVEMLFDVDGKADVMQIYLQCGEITSEPTIVLNDAYLVSGAQYNPVIWRGEEALTGWSNSVQVKPQQFKAGDRIGFVFLAGEEGGSFKACCVDAGWQWRAMTSYSDYPGYSAEWESVWMDHNGAVAAYIDEADAANCVNGLQIAGDGLTLIKVLYFPAETQTSIYVTGDGDNLGGWDLANALAVEGVFGIHLFRSDNLSSFKFSTVETTDWEEFNSRAFAAGECVIGQNDLNVIPVDWNNSTPWKGDYDVIVDLCAMTMQLSTETPQPSLDELEIYLRGSMNSWGAEPEYLFSTTDGVVYTLAGVSIEAGDEFKFATSDWSTVDLGGASDMVVDTPYVLSTRGANCTVAESVSDVTIVLNLEDNTVELSTKNGIAGIAGIAADAADAVYYNLQGVRVANPANGIFVKKQGNTVTKVYLR